MRKIGDAAAQRYYDRQAMEAAFAGKWICRNCMKPYFIPMREGQRYRVCPDCLNHIGEHIASYEVKWLMEDSA